MKAGLCRPAGLIVRERPMMFGRWRRQSADGAGAPSGDADADVNADALLAPTEELAQMLYAAYTDRQNRVHVETMLGGAAALTGEFALRATGLPLPEHGFVLGDPINDILCEAKDRLTLWDVLKSTASVTSLKESDLPDHIAIIRGIAEAIGAISGKGDGDKTFPPLSIPDDNYPHEWSPNACPRLRERVAAIGKRHHLTPRQLAFALAYAIVGIIKEAQEILAPAIAVRLVAEVMFATAKMAPLKRPVV
jgi:hypothetical protein